MKTLEITKRMYQSGTAYEGWADADGFGRVGGPYADLLCSACDADDPISIVSLVDFTPVGQINLMKGAVLLKGERIPVYWGSGLVVPPEHRATGAGLAIMAKMRGLVPGSGAVSVSLQALPLYKKLGWFCLTAQRHVLPVKPSTFLRFKLGNGVWIGMLGVLADGLTAVYRQGVRAVLDFLTPKMRVEPADAASDIDPAWFQNHTNLPYTTERSAEWLRRIMTMGPMDNARRLFLVRAPSGSVAGYFITTVAMRNGVANGRFGDLQVASLRDWVSFDQSRLSDSDVLLLGLRALLEVRCDVIELCVPSEHPAPVLRRLGLRRIGELQFALRLNPQFGEKFPDVKLGRLWWFRPGDGDAFLL